MSIGFFVQDFSEHSMAVVYRSKGHTVVAVSPDLSLRCRAHAAIELLTDEEIDEWWRAQHT